MWQRLVLKQIPLSDRLTMILAQLARSPHFNTSQLFVIACLIDYTQLMRIACCYRNQRANRMHSYPSIIIFTILNNSRTYRLFYMYLTMLTCAVEIFVNLWLIVGKQWMISVERFEVSLRYISVKTTRHDTGTFTSLFKLSWHHPTKFPRLVGIRFLSKETHMCRDYRELKPGNLENITKLIFSKKQRNRETWER